MNKCILIGNLTKDPELTTTNSGISVCRFTLAVSRRFANAEGERETDFINIIVWRKQAENVKNYLTQGSQVAVEGRMQVRNYDDKDGVKRYVTEVVAETVQFLDTKASRERTSNSGPSPYDMPTSSYMDSNPVADMDIRTEEIKDDPFKDFGEEIKIADSELPF